MSNSLAIHADLTCFRCRISSKVEVWVVVDCVGSPDLVEDIRKEDLHIVACPLCGYEQVADIPLLLFHSGKNSPLVFSPPQDATGEEGQNHAILLVELLRRQLASNWQDGWLARGLPVVPREELAEFINDYMKHPAADSETPSPLGALSDGSRQAIRRAVEDAGRYQTSGDAQALSRAVAAWESVLADDGLGSTREDFRGFVLAKPRVFQSY